MGDAAPGCGAPGVLAANNTHTIQSPAQPQILPLLEKKKKNSKLKNTPETAATISSGSHRGSLNARRQLNNKQSTKTIKAILGR